LFFVDPYPSVSDVRQSIGKTKKSPHASLTDRYAAEEAFYSEHLTSIQEHSVGAKSLLEVGCGTGKLLELMSDAGLDCEGVELDPERAEAARSRSGCTVHTAPVEELQTVKTYDVITMINVLSHIPSLPELFASLGRLLSDQGRLIIMAGEMRDDSLAFAPLPGTGHRIHLLFSLASASWRLAGAA
jgi:2-polyprenyl-3-methyl-5-hydroxy-6-metoxy-1,4-benzoquinol methylase